MKNDFHLSRNQFGRLVLAIGGEVHDGVIPVRSFPISCTNEGIALMSPAGTELIWVDRLSDLPDEARALVEEELASREFVPEIRRILEVSTFATPSQWKVETDRGNTVLVLKAEEDIRRLAGTTLLIADGQGVQYLIRDVGALDKNSRRLLDRFL